MALTVPSVLLLCLGAAFFYWFYLRRLCVDTTPRNFHVYEALRSPSMREATNALERRIAMAVREAARGSRLCAVCDFANTTQMKDASCALCGAPLPRPPRHGLARLMPASPKSADQESTKGHSSRQRRVRRRKEWVREVDERGNVVWHHDPQTRGPLLTDFPCYVLQSSRKHDRDVEDKLEEEITIQVDKPDTPESEPADPGNALTHIVSALQANIDSTSVNIVNEAVSDPAYVAFTSSTTTSAVPKATLEYPAKLVDFMTSVASLLNEKTNESSMTLVARFSIVRDELWKHSVEAIATMTPDQVRYPIRVEFVGEPGIDAGALYREWIGVLNKTLITPEAGIFTCVDPHEQIFYLNPHSRERLGETHLAHFLVAGRLIGRALLDGNVTGFHLAPPLLKIILGLPVGFDDLEYFDAEAFKSLQWLVTNDGVDALGLDFTVVEKLPDGKMKVVELVPGGSEVDVTDANKLEYIDRKLKYLLFESVQSQLFAFLTGLYEVAPADLLTAFDAEELALLLSGSDEIDVDDWEANTIAYIETETSERKRLALLPCYENFWKVVHAMSNDERRRLLHFATGSTRPPPGGFSSLTSYDGRLALFTMRGVTVETTHGYLQSHACFNRLDIPTFWGITNLRKAIYAAIATEEDGFTIA